MRVLIQRVKASRVEVAGKIVGEIGHGLMLLVGLTHTDTPVELAWMARKCLELRIFPDQDGKFAQSVEEIQGELLVVSQFTLYGNCVKGRRPSFDQAAPSESAQRLYDQFVGQLRQSGLQVETGKFGADMQVLIENDGPVTLWLEREANKA
jgi:D-aminoacyl-tRNA deacylase